MKSYLHDFFEETLSQLPEGSSAKTILWQLVSCPQDRVRKELVQLASSHPEVTVGLLEKLVDQYPRVEYLEIYGHCLLRLQQTEQAKLIYQKILALDDSVLGVRFNLAQALQKLRDYESALTQLEHCLNVYPSNVTFLFQSGSCHLQLEQLDAAKSFFQKVLDQDAYHLETLVNFGTCFLKEKDYSKAIYYFATACRVNENHLPARYNLASCLMSDKRYIQAKDQWQIYLDQMPNDFDARFQLAYSHLRCDAIEESEACFQEILQLQPNNTYVLQNLAFIGLKKNEPSVALGFFQRVLAQEPEDEIALYMRAVLTQQAVPKQAPSSYVRNLFDAYAIRFDEHLQGRLQYKTPEHLYELWKEGVVRKDSWVPTHRILDLGCGTGLAGQLFKRHAKELVGVDLSGEMLAIARQKKLYDQLVESEALHYLSSTTQRFDLAILADVLVYMGDLDELFARLSQVTTTVLLSIELHVSEGDYFLSSRGRYQHHADYIRALINKYNFQEVLSREVILRYEMDEPVKGVIFYCKIQ